MAEPDWFAVDEAAATLHAHDRGEDVDLGVWEHETPEVERRDYQREVARIAVVLDVLLRRQGTS